MKAMILAAGLGTRLLPYTLKRPKPLFPILTKPLLNLTVAKLKKTGFSNIVVNSHHLRQQITDSLKDDESIILQEETEVLGTGGGLRMALPRFDKDPVLVVNGDIYHSIDYREVLDYHDGTGADVTLVLHDCPRFNDVTVGDSQRITGFNGPEEDSTRKGRILAFTGIHVINPEVLKTIPHDKASCIIDCYRDFLIKGGAIKAYIAEGHFWTDMGTPEDYLKLHGGLLTQMVPVYEELEDMITGDPFAGLQHASVAKDAKLLDWVSIGKGATIGSGVTLQRSVVWDGAVVPAGSIITDTIVTN
jgi:mannose-1-phosphate guanylyltransferase